MADAVDTAFIKALAEANGLSIPESRLEIVRKQHQTYLELLARLDSFPLDRTAEPAVTFSLPAEEAGAAPRRPK